MFVSWESMVFLWVCYRIIDSAGTHLIVLIFECISTINRFRRIFLSKNNIWAKLMWLPKQCIIYILVDNVRLSPTKNKSEIWEMSSRLIFKLLAWDFCLFFNHSLSHPPPLQLRIAVWKPVIPVAYKAGRKKWGGGRIKGKMDLNKMCYVYGWHSQKTTISESKVVFGFFVSVEACA